MEFRTPFHIETSAITSHAWGRGSLDAAVLKLDALQPTGSFKLRGVGAWFAHAIANGARRVICPSGGNAGFAAAYCGRRSGVAVTIVVPRTTSEEARQAIEETGAEVTVFGADFDEADLRARALARQNEWAYLHPFDDPLLWRGHSTLIDEVLAAGDEFDCVVTSVGGGGLLLGILEGLERHGLRNLPVIAVETEGAASLHSSLQANERVTLDRIATIATSLGAKRIAESAFERARDANVLSLTVSDSQAIDACLKLANTARILVEPACGASLAALDVHCEKFVGCRRPLVEVCGGIGVTIEKLLAWHQKSDGAQSRPDFPGAQ